MHEFIFKGFLLRILQFSIGKVILKNKFENRFSKPTTGFRFSNRKPDFRFRLTSLPEIPQKTRIFSGYVHKTAIYYMTHNKIQKLIRLPDDTIEHSGPEGQSLAHVTLD